MPYRLRSTSHSFLIALFVVLLAIAFNETAIAQSTDPDFTIVVLPDTQYYSASYPQIFTAQTNWIVNHQSSLNIKLVLGVGDIVNGGGSSTQWLNADKAVKVQPTFQQPAPEPTTGAVSGKVANLSTGGALSGATVKYSGGSTTTNTSGLYSFPTVAPGTYTFTTSKSGYLSRSTSVTVTSGTTTTADIALSTAGKISGTVKNASGVAISGATVTITGGNIATTVSKMTSSTGTYGTAYIPIGSYKVAVSKSGYTTQTKSTTVYSGKTSTVSFTMK